MKTLFITRKDYDALLKAHRDWMTIHWCKTFKRSWNINGVIAKGTSQDIAHLRYLVSTATNRPF